MSYIPIKIEVLSVCGVKEALEAMRLPKNESSGDSQYGKYTLLIGPKDRALARKLILAGDDHAKAMRGVIAYLRIHMQVGFMIEFETYRHGVECLSTSSSMHNELVRLRGAELAEKKQRDLAEKVYTRIVLCSYQAIRHMYCARKSHRHPDWKIFCRVIEGLPYFAQLIYPEGEKDGEKEKGEN